MSRDGVYREVLLLQSNYARIEGCLWQQSRLTQKHWTNRHLIPATSAEIFHHHYLVDLL